MTYGMTEREALEFKRDAGMLPGLDADRILGVADGDVALLRNPLSALRDDPMLWGVWDEFRFGARLDPSLAEYQGLSAWHLDALTCARMARRRELERRSRPAQEPVS